MNPPGPTRAPPSTTDLETPTMTTPTRATATPALIELYRAAKADQELSTLRTCNVNVRIQSAWARAAAEAFPGTPAELVDRAFAAILDGRLGLDSRAEIDAARAEIAHRCDGPITSYVLIARALQAAAQGRHGYEALANGLDAELRERGYLVEGEDEIPGS